ncbi:hypothetical protein [Sulfobacillus sp. hq2]|uniref:hypothetical protein n=1 Tax=Sulfobacillus sp. hq2 TaxID=2039167 RepID=UPI000CD07C9B|nr:hypothetical protein [Sulfobacillus sp. hq2]POB11351.1 hypothetical protein CO251_05415 [Sulfobacillus sp. hq2]
MTLMTWAYLLFLATSTGGGVLFFAYVLPGRRFPLIALVGHLILATITMVLLLFAFRHNGSSVYHILGWTVFVYILTFLLGIIFFMAFDMRGRRLPLRYLTLHVSLTIVTFVLFTSAVSLRIPYGNPQGILKTGSQSSLWQLIHRHNSQHHYPALPPKGL